MITGIPYSEKYKGYIKDLNYEWPEKYFFVEPDDSIQLSDPEGEIPGKGGHIWYLLEKEEIAGTISLMKLMTKNMSLLKWSLQKNIKAGDLAKY